VQLFGKYGFSLTSAEGFLIVVNISQNPLNPQAPNQLVEQNKTWRKNGMFDLVIQVLAAVGLFALPFIFIGYVRSRVRSTLKAHGKVN
jgi:hypothetical protein